MASAHLEASTAFIVLTPRINIIKVTPGQEIPIEPHTFVPADCSMPNPEVLCTATTAVVVFELHGNTHEHNPIPVIKCNGDGCTARIFPTVTTPTPSSQEVLS